MDCYWRVWLVFFMIVGLATLPKWHRSITHCFGFFRNTFVFLAKDLVKERPALDLSRAERVLLYFPLYSAGSCNNVI